MAPPGSESLPSKRYFTIGEASALCGVKPHVLRYWEQSFPQLKPVKRRGNRRYYQQHDLLMIRQIRSLVYDQGFTTGGARQRLAESRAPAKPSAAASPKDQAIDQTLAELEDLLKTLS